MSMRGARSKGTLLGVLVLLGWGSAAASTPAVLERSVVRIVNHSQRGDWYAPWKSKTVRESSGSGFVVEGGRVMTNAHVVSDARMLVIFLHGDPRPHPARVAAIGHDTDLALLEPEQQGLLDGIPPLEIGGLPAPLSTVVTYGYPAGGRRISSTRGVVSRIEIRSYVHSAVDAHLAVQTDAAINPGNSGGPVIQDGRVVGVAFQSMRHLNNVGYFIPAEVIRHFLEDASDGTYDGYPELGVFVSNMENPAARRDAVMAGHDTGVRVDLVLPRSSADGHVRPGDVILKVEDHEVANDGTIEEAGLRLHFLLLVDRLQIGNTVTLTVLREGRRKLVSVPLRSYPPYRIRENTYDRLPRYYVYAGLVFAPLNREFLKTWGGNWRTRADKDLLYEVYHRLVEDPENLRREPVVLVRRLDHPVNSDLAWFKNLLVDRVNGQRIDCLEDLIRAIETHEGQYHLFEYGYRDRFGVLDREAADRAHREIMERYGVSGDRRR